jgi:hypothetical protein
VCFVTLLGREKIFSFSSILKIIPTLAFKCLVVALKGVFMNSNDLNLPEQWREVSHYDLRIAWLHNQPKASSVAFMEEVEREHGKKISLEVTGRPGWWLYSNVLKGASFDSLEEALAFAKSTLKNSDFAASPFNFDVTPGFKAPVRLSKSQRIKLIDEIMHEPKGELEEGLVREAFLQVDDYALSVWIEDIPYPEEFEAMFAAPENPLRSLEGEVCTVYTSALDEDFDGEDFEDEDFDDDFDMDDLEMDDLGEEEVKEFRDYLEALQKGETPELPAALQKLSEGDDEEDLNELEDSDDLDDLDDLEDFDEDDERQGDDWQEVAKGVLRLEGNTVHVGDWHCTVSENELVFGTAFRQASFDLKDARQTILIEKENTNE